LNDAASNGWIEWQVMFKFLLGFKINDIIAVLIVLDNIDVDLISPSAYVARFLFRSVIIDDGLQSNKKQDEMGNRQ